MRTLRPSPHPSRRPGAPCLLLTALLALAAGCVTGPNLRALNPDEAKIDVYADGTVHVLGEPVAMGDLSGIVERSSTGPADTILVRLHGDPTSPAFVELRRYVTDQMIRAGHYKFRFELRTLRRALLQGVCLAVGVAAAWSESLTVKYGLGGLALLSSAAYSWRLLSHETDLVRKLRGYLTKFSRKS